MPPVLSPGRLRLGSACKGRRTRLLRSLSGFKAAFSPREAPILRNEERVANIKIIVGFLGCAHPAWQVMDQTPLAQSIPRWLTLPCKRAKLNMDGGQPEPLL